MSSESTQISPFPTEPCPTYHVHDDESWEWGIACERCPAPRFLPGSRFGGIRFSIRHLKLQNEMGQTVREQVAEIYEGARERGADITRA